MSRPLHAADCHCWLPKPKVGTCITHAVNRRIREIQKKAVAHDFEVAHVIEDELREYALDQIKAGNVASTRLTDFVTLVLSTGKIQFSRVHS